jgi:phosphatidate cytidylyltransferase
MVAPLALAIAAGPGEDGPGPSQIARAGATAFPLAWVVFLGGFLLERRLIEGTAAGDIPLGLGLCLTVAASVKLGDSAAYFVGKTIGRHPMCWVSPKKTWEGALASVVGAIAVAVLLGGVLEIDPRLMAGLGLVSNLAGQGGDLVESHFKRAMGAKDSATTFGEMGGILDMLDALLLAAPAAYVWCRLLIVREMPL